MGKSLSDEDVVNLTWQQKSELIQSDPVITARHFDHRVQVFFHGVLNSSLAPIGQIDDFFYRVEFQQRGSPHIHCLFWIHGAPQYGRDPDNDVIAFIDRYLTCKRHTEAVELTEVSKLHEHKHTQTCKKGEKLVCRFGFPIPPMPATSVLEPVPEDMLPEVKTKHQQNYDKIRQQLHVMKY